MLGCVRPLSAREEPQPLVRLLEGGGTQGNQRRDKLRQLGTCWAPQHFGACVPSCVAVASTVWLALPVVGPVLRAFAQLPIQSSHSLQRFIVCLYCLSLRFQLESSPEAGLSVLSLLSLPPLAREVSSWSFKRFNWEKICWVGGLLRQGGPRAC